MRATDWHIINGLSARECPYRCSCLMDSHHLTLNLLLTCDWLHLIVEGITAFYFELRRLFIRVFDKYLGIFYERNEVTLRTYFWTYRSVRQAAVKIDLSKSWETRKAALFTCKYGFCHTNYTFSRFDRTNTMKCWTYSLGVKFYIDYYLQCNTL